MKMSTGFKEELVMLKEQIKGRIRIFKVQRMMKKNISPRHQEKLRDLELMCVNNYMENINAKKEFRNQRKEIKSFLKKTNTIK